MRRCRGVPDRSLPRPLRRRLAHDRVRAGRRRLGAGAVGSRCLGEVRWSAFVLVRKTFLISCHVRNSAKHWFPQFGIFLYSQIKKNFVFRFVVCVVESDKNTSWVVWLVQIDRVAELCNFLFQAHGCCIRSLDGSVNTFSSAAAALASHARDW